MYVAAPIQDASMELLDRGCLNGAHTAILLLVEADQYARYKESIIVQRQLRMARLDALWWLQVNVYYVDVGTCAYRS